MKAVELLSKVGDVVGFRSSVKNLKALNDDGISCSKPLPVENYKSNTYEIQEGKESRICRKKTLGLRTTFGFGDKVSEFCR